MQNPTENTEISRPLANFQPSIWGNRFFDYTPPNEETQRQWKEEAEELKEVVRKELEAVNEDPKEKLEYVDAVLRLGVAYHFEKEIDDNLQAIYNNLHCDDDGYEDDLHYVSLRFRLLRQHGFYASSDVFEKFICKNGKFKDFLANDVQGILSLYEASYLRVHGESILDEALIFATACLTSFDTQTPQLSSPMAEQVAHSLKLPLHKRTTRLESTFQINFYESKPSHDNKLLRFSKLDFNLVQVVHNLELRDLTRWSRNFTSIIKLPKFSRDRDVEGYYWSMGAYYEPKYSYARMWFNKLFKIISIIDDIYDAYGTLEELEILTDAFRRWDKSCINQLPEYMRLFYQAILDTFEEIEQDLATEGRSYAVYYVRQKLVFTCEGYLEEAKWREQKIVPTYDDYFKNGLLTSGYMYIHSVCFLGMGEIANKDAFEWINLNSKTPRASCVITRLIDDIADHKLEQEREHVASAVECYMRQFIGISEEEAYREIELCIEGAWKDINEDLVGSIRVKKSVLNVAINVTRVLNDFFRMGEDGYTTPDYLQAKIAAVLVNPLII